MSALDHLSGEPRWVGWLNEPRGPEGKLTKVPYSPSGRKAEADDPATWGTRAEAELVYKRLANGHGGGIGIELGDVGGDLFLCGIDLDTCINEGKFEPWAAEVLRRFASYSEISPSRRGAKIFFYVVADDVVALRAATQINSGRQWKIKTGDDHPPAIELYLSHRFFAVTGYRLTSAPDEIKVVDYNRLLWLINEAGPFFVGVNKSNSSSGRGADKSRSAAAFRKGAAVRRAGKNFEEMCEVLRTDPETADWYREKGEANNKRELWRIWQKAANYNHKIDTGPDWLSDCMTSAKGEIIPNLANALLGMRADPAWDGVLAYDEMLRTAVQHKAVPGASDASNGTRPVRDEDVAAAQEWLQYAGIKTIGKDTAHQAIDRIAWENPFHPVREYLDGLIWDGEERLPTWLHKYLGTEEDAYTTAIGTMFVISMVARIYRPGCKVDYMLILQGGQGAKKSLACGILAGEWFSDDLPEDLGSKDAKQHLRGKWLIEIAELHAFNRSEMTTLKAFLTRRQEIYRPSYGRKEVHEERQVVFIGTTNKSIFLRDETGGRRFWPTIVGTIDLKQLAANRDQLFAEAVARYKRKERWWPDPAFEQEHITPEQEARYEGDAWEALIDDWLRRQVTKKVIIHDVAEKALLIETPRLGRGEQLRIVAAMERCGWKRGTRTGKAQWWVPKEVNE